MASTQEQIDALIAAMLANAAGPLQASNDTGSVTARPLAEQMEAIRFLEARRASRDPFGCLKATQIAPSGTVFHADNIRYIDPREAYPRRHG